MMRMTRARRVVDPDSSTITSKNSSAESSPTAVVSKHMQRHTQSQLISRQRKSLLVTVLVMLVLVLAFQEPFRITPVKMEHSTVSLSTTAAPTSRSSPQTANKAPQMHRNYTQGRPYYSSHPGSKLHKPYSIPIDRDDPSLVPGKGWDASPIVIQKYKLLFYTTPKVGTTVFKQLFRRMMGYQDWPRYEGGGDIPHNPQHNGLMYMHDCPNNLLEEIWDPSGPWTRAIFVRDPAERALSAYLDKAIHKNGTYIKRHCCGIKPPKKRTNLHLEEQMKLLIEEKEARPIPELDPAAAQSPTEHRRLQALQLAPRRTSGINLGPPSVEEGTSIPEFCSKMTLEQAANISFTTFVHDFLPNCSKDPHWSKQSEEVPSTAWKYINFVGHFERLQEDTRRLLEKIGAWEEHGRKDWPPHGGAIFERNPNGQQAKGQELWDQFYSTGATSEDKESTLKRNLLDEVKAYYASDYELSYLELSY